MKRRLLFFAVLLSGVAGAFLLFQSLFFHLKVIKIDSPLEYRENSTVVLTDLIRRGKVPYTASVMPLYTNVYGMVYNLVMVPFVSVFGTSLSVYRIVNGLFYVFCLWLLYVVLQKKRVSKGISLLLLVMWYSQTIQSSFDILARPDGLGEFLFLSSIIIPWYFKYSKKSFIASIVLSVLSFYTKPYFALGGIVFGIYLFLFVSRRIGFRYIFWLALTFGISVAITQYFMEFYFYNTVLFHLKNARYMVGHLIGQTQIFSKNNIGLLLILGFELLRNIFTKKIFQVKTYKNIEYFLFYFLVMSALVLGKFGGHDGNLLSYFTELMGPFVILVAGPILEKYKQNILIWFCIIFNLTMLYKVGVGTIKMDVGEIEKNWTEWTMILDSYSSIYAPPPFAKYLLEKGKDVYDTGHTEYFTKSMSKFNFFLFNDARDAYNIHLHELDRKIRNREFDMVIVFKGYVYYDFLYTGYLSYFIEQNYVLKEAKPLILYHNQVLPFEIWVRK